MSHDTTYTELFIRDGKTEVNSLKNFYNTNLIMNKDNPNHIFKVPFNDFFIEHSRELSNIITFHQIPQRMFYKPKLVSLDLYGTTELWLALLRVNGMKNVTEFHYPFIRVYDPNLLQDYIDIFFKREGKE